MKKQNHQKKVLLGAICVAALLATACGGGKSDGSSPQNAVASSGSSTPQVAAPSVSLQVAQSHVLPPQGLKWTNDTAGHLRASAERDTLVLARFNGMAVTAPIVDVVSGSTIVGTYALKPPKQLPPSEGGDEAFSDSTWSVMLPADKVTPGIALRVREGGRALHEPVVLTVAPRSEVTFQLLAYLLFGAKRDTSGLMQMTDSERAQGESGMPFTKTRFVDHPIGAFESSYLILPPTGTLAATKALSKDEMVSDPLLDMTWLINEAAGDLPLNRVTFGAKYMLGADGKRAWAGGGVSYPGSGVAVGDPSFGLLWHEGGHAMSLGHSPADLQRGTFPYEAGSLKGSAWGFDQSKGYFRSPLTTPNSWYAKCEGDKAERGGQWFPKDSRGRCYRFDPMHSADDQKDPQAAFPLFSDYNVGRVQRWALQRDAINDTNTGFLRLNAANDWVNWPMATADFAWDGLNAKHAAMIGKDMDFVFITHSLAGTALASQFYKPVRHVGNGLQLIDPMDSVQLASIHATNSGKASASYYKYCHSSGCDFTVRATYEGVSTPSYRVLRGSGRQWAKPEQWKETVNDEKQRDSFLWWAINIPTPAGKPRLKKLELLSTPMVWGMTPAAIAAAPVAATLDVF
ncbi:M66 family metalloprotease [Rhodoferax aquaticus]|nr:M66 family metalloprotease [Rhodoferax aquaticus]